jgi:quercetin dioxygenase-like cupin family protein
MDMELSNHSQINSLIGSIEYSKDAVVSKIILNNQGGSVTLFAFDKGQGLSEHSAPFDALVNIIDGKVNISINKENYLVSAGEWIIMPANIPHALKSVTAFKMVLTMIKN